MDAPQFNGGPDKDYGILGRSTGPRREPDVDYGIDPRGPKCPGCAEPVLACTCRSVQTETNDVTRSAEPDVQRTFSIHASTVRKG